MDEFVFPVDKYRKNRKVDNDSTDNNSSTNISKQQFEILKPSERASLITTYYEKLKKSSGFRSDIHSQTTCIPMEHRSTLNDETSVPSEPRLNTRAIVANLFGIKPSSVQRYLLLNNLIPTLKELLDNDELSMRPAVEISYLDIKEQELVADILNEGVEITTDKANKIRLYSKENEIDTAIIRRFLI